MSREGGKERGKTCAHKTKDYSAIQGVLSQFSLMGQNTQYKEWRFIWAHRFPGFSLCSFCFAGQTIPVGRECVVRGKAAHLMAALEESEMKMQGQTITSRILPHRSTSSNLDLPPYNTIKLLIHQWLIHRGGHSHCDPITSQSPLTVNQAIFNKWAFG